MTPAIQQLLQQALALPGEEQLQLITALVAAVDERGLRPFDDSWLAEIQRRSAEYDDGGVQPVPWAEVQEKDQLETIAAVKESLQDVAAGRTRPMREAMVELVAKHRLPPVQDQ